ncbi:pyruvate ferredoxin oxidoreductase [Myxococcota bacterium]|nr:pyruvate ferredoxin oxidoreductase [Myxococcota bacterium]MBU1379600.1 pyruvate ferredoxin oxidoreductase [Myxococcota bacterium]MBU1496297.1 pyruvate ferredoxin oxidoreductase [Myxococcota bacterium]
MVKRKGVESSIALADAAAMCNVDAISAYPITPQTHIVEHLSEWVNNGELDAEFIPVESEHSAMSAALGTSAMGARTFTATASQGLALMHEILFIAPAMRLPVVMAVANRALSGPISIWNDHGDIMCERDIGWIQIFAENGQECFDLTPACFKIAEDKRVILPTILNFDGFIVSHMIEPIEYWEQETINNFLPDFEPQIKLDIRNPSTMGAVGVPEIYYEARIAQNEALLNSKSVIKEVFEEVTKITGRPYNLVESYNMEKAEVALFMMGSLTETAMTAVKNLKKRGIEVGIVRPRLWRPYPTEEIIEAIGNIKALGIVDRAMGFGAQSHPVASEVKSTLYSSDKRPVVCEYVIGLGGRDVRIEDIEAMFLELIEAAKSGKSQPVKYIGVRE